MWLDSDIVFEPRHFKTLLDQMETNKSLHILSGLYLKALGKEFATIPSWNKKHSKMAEKLKYLKPQDIKNKRAVQKVEVTGLGFMLVRHGVFEKLSYPWFRPLGISKGDGQDNFTSEDTSFCFLTQQLGIATWIDPKVVVGHEKTTILR